MIGQFPLKLSSHLFKIDIGEYITQYVIPLQTNLNH